MKSVFFIVFLLGFSSFNFAEENIERDTGLDAATLVADYPDAKDPNIVTEAPTKKLSPSLQMALKSYNDLHCSNDDIADQHTVSRCHDLYDTLVAEGVSITEPLNFY